MPEEEDLSCAPIFAPYQSIYYTNYIVKKLQKTYKMYMKTLTYLISKIKTLILAVKDQKIDLLSIIMCFDSNLPLHLQKQLLSIFQLKSSC